MTEADAFTDAAGSCDGGGGSISTFAVGNDVDGMGLGALPTSGLSMSMGTGIGGNVFQKVAAWPVFGMRAPDHGCSTDGDGKGRMGF